MTVVCRAFIHAGPERKKNEDQQAPMADKKKSPYQSVRNIILACMLVLPFVPFALSIAIGYNFFAASTQSSAVASTKRIVADHRHMIDSFLRERRGDLEFAIQSHSFDELRDPRRLADLFGLLQKESNAFIDLGIFDEHGVHVRYHGPYELTGIIYRETEWFKAVIQQGYYISDIFLGYRKIPHFVIAVVRVEEGRPWVLRATVDTQLFNQMVEAVRIGQTGEAYILAADNRLQTDRRSGGRLMDRCRDRLRYPASTSGIETFIETDEQGETYLYATTWMKEKNWLLVVRQKKSDAFSALHRAGRIILIISLVGGAVIVAAGFYLTGYIVKRMERLDAEKNQLNQQLIRAVRLAELGEMAAGFAHEINNPLQIIKNEHSLIRMILGDFKEQKLLSESESLTELEDSLAQIDLQVRRSAKITEAILNFGRQTEPVRESIDLNRLIPSIIAMVQNKSDVHGIEIRRDLPDPAPIVQGDPAQLQQVLINLLNNAIDAVVERHGHAGGKLLVAAQSNENGSVDIIVRDNGRGISAENMKKIFMPFFTTKAVGKGTGLGLSVCYGIISSMGGTISVDSTEGEGSAFHVRLPVNSK